MPAKVSQEAALAAALEQIQHAFGKGSPPVEQAPDDEPELTPEEAAEELARLARWSALPPEEREAQWAEWEAQNAPNGLPF